MAEAAIDAPRSEGLKLSRALIVTLIFAAAAVPVIATEVFPFIDFYSHIARYFVLAHVGETPYLAQNYQPHWVILPNIGADVLGVNLMRVMPPLAAAKLLVLLIFAIQYFGILAFSRALLGRVSLMTAVLAVPLLYSFILTWGFANFLLGLGLVFWAAVWWLKQRSRPWLAIPAACLWAVLIFLCHGVAFVLYGVLLGSLELGFFFTSPDRRPVDLIRRMAGLAVQAVAPAILFLMSPTAESPEGLTNADDAIKTLHQNGQLAHRLQELLVYRATTVFRVSESPSLALDAVAFVAILGILGFLIWTGRVTLPRLIWPALAILAVLACITPPEMFGVGYVSDRIPLFMAFLIVGSLTWALRSRTDFALAAVIVGVLAVRLVATGVEWRSYSADLADFRAVVRSAPPGSLLVYIDAVDGVRLDHHRRCEMFGPLSSSLGGAVVPMFASPSQQPMLLKGPLAQSVKTLPLTSDKDPAGQVASNRFESTIGRSRFQYALVCEREHLLRPPPAGATLIAERGRLALYQLPPVTP